jgi:uncharacterized membrane protein
MTLTHNRTPQVCYTIGISAGTLLFTALPVYAQGCALCYTQAAASGSRMIHALLAGIVILVFPSLVLSAFFTILAYRKRSRFRHFDVTLTAHHRYEDPTQRRRLLQVRQQN